MSEFFVDADGLDTGRNGFGEKASEIESLAQLIASLGDPGRVAAAAGNDNNGTSFTQTHVKAVSEIHDGIKAWSRAVDGTKDAIGDMASSFREADAGAFDMATDLRNSFEKLNDGSGGSSDGSSDGSSNPPVQPTKAFMTKRRLAEPGEPAEFRALEPMKKGEMIPAEQGVLAERMPASQLMPAEKGVLADRIPAEQTVPLEPARRIEAMPAEPGVPAEPLQPREFVRSSKPEEPLQPTESFRAERRPADPGVPAEPLQPTESFPRDVGVRDEGVVTEAVSTPPIPTNPA
ncbi:hypothetical protein [Amycolatopsis sp. NBC_01480]|uniref:hypothetical protein n=1 Tax=Amycolatopsis sp. NBC_01480 TaxID=2903562 RepID=UPI002E2C95D5|nr:hypothetical protein [Amycolatopsis sp. NBC_01480]